MTQTVPKVLAIDFGTQRIGLAVSRGTLAEPLTVLPNEPGVLAQIKQICQDEQVEGVVVGLSEGEMAEKTKVFIQQLQAEIELPFHTTDETLSSYQVNQLMRRQGIKKSKRTGPIDHFAAAVFLQDWIDSY
jgi:putative transcription antitermination factor YqgF